MPDMLSLLAQTSEYGPLALIVQYATYAFLAASALYLLVRGRNRKWEPVDTEVPRLAERTALVIGAVTTVIVFALLDDRRFISVLAVACSISALLLFGAFIHFLRLSSRYLHEAPHLVLKGRNVPQTIVGDRKRLTPEAQTQLDKGVSLRDLIWGCGQQFDRVFDHDSRADLKVAYQVTYFFLVLCFVVTLACAGELLALAARPPAP